MLSAEVDNILQDLNNSHPRRSNGSPSGREKRRDESFQVRAKDPLSILSPNYFQKFKQMAAPDWAQKMRCIIVPNRRTVSFREFVHDGYCLGTLARLVHLVRARETFISTFLTRNEGTIDESKKRLGCYQQ